MNDDLADRATELQREVEGLRLAVEQLGARTARAEKVSFRAAGAAMALLTVVMLLGWTVWQQHQTADRVEAVTQRALCPVFALVIGGYDPGTRNEGEGRDRYETTFAAFRAAYGELRCIAPLVPPREDS